MINYHVSKICAVSKSYKHLHIPYTKYNLFRLQLAHNTQKLMRLGEWAVATILQISRCR